MQTPERRSGTKFAALFIVASLVGLPRPQHITGAEVTIVCTSLVIVLISGRVGRQHSLARPPALGLAFVGLAAASTLWSDDPHATARAAAAMLVSLVGAAIVADVMPLRGFLTVANRTFICLIGLSLALKWADPSTALTQRDVLAGTLRGLYEQRNNLGFIIVIGLIVALGSWNATPQAERHRGRLVAQMVVYLAALYYSGSMSSIGLVALTLAIYGFLNWLRKTATGSKQAHMVLAASACFAGAAGIIAVIAFPHLAAFAGRTDSLDSRSEIWRGSWAAWKPVFLKGYGWDAILGQSDTAGETISSFSGYAVRSTHNGYLSTGLQDGILGLVIGVVYLLRLAARSYGLSSKDTVAGFFCFQITLALILADFVETRAFAPLGFFLLAIVAAYAHRASASEATGPLRPAVRAVPARRSEFRLEVSGRR